jgi:alkylation response protein AidB-like acyl-CoA dehydrogenase
MQFIPTSVSPAELTLRDEVREHLREAVPAERRTMLGMAGVDGHDPVFSRSIAARGWLGLTVAKELGGQGGTAVQRLLLTEELLAAQAPVAAHWVADRQSAPVIASYGTPEQKARFIPAIVAGEAYFSIGMSEPDAGSDLAAVSTTAVKVEGGWRLNGTKVWTTLAHLNHWFIVLCRTAPSERRHEGLSQLIVDLHAPGVTVRPITTLDGEQEFCEVSLEDVFVPDDLLLGEEGDGWAQCTGELAFERGGPDRYLSAWGLLAHLVTHAPEGSQEVLGRLLARYRIVRELALSAARTLDQGGQPATEAAVTKDLGTILEQDTVEAVRAWLLPELDPWSSDRLEQLLARAVLTSATFTLRGGTTEILRSIVARGAGQPPAEHDLLAQTVKDILTDRCPPDVVRAGGGTFATDAWCALAEAGLAWVGVDEEVGGSGGTVRDAATVLRLAGGHATPLPLAETALLGGWLLQHVGHKLPDGPITIALQHDLLLCDGVLTGSVRRVPFLSDASLVLAVVGDRLVGFEPCSPDGGRALSGEPRAGMSVDARPLLEVATPCSGAELLGRAAATRVLLMAGALRSVLTLAANHTRTRVQFGQPLAKFQAVGQQLAVLVEQVARVEMAAELATRWLEGDADVDDLAVATVTAREAVTTGAKIAHQVHGAIGIAQEYDLQLLTRRLWTWRDECGTEREWAVRLGTRAVQLGGEQLWTWTSR